MKTNIVRVRTVKPCLWDGRAVDPGTVLTGDAAGLGELVRLGRATLLPLRERFMVRSGVAFEPRRK